MTTKFTFRLFFLCIMLIGYSQMSFGQKKLPNFEKSFAKITDSLYASKYEVTNQAYISFLNEMGNSGDSTLFLDTLNWKNAIIPPDAYVKNYFRHKAYAHYPVLNVRFEAAQKFCQWLTDKYNLSPKRKFKKVLFRLPTETEWELAAHGGTNYSYPWGYDLYKKGQNLCNFRQIGDEYIKRDSTNKSYYVNYNDDIVLKRKRISNKTIVQPAPVACFWPNNFGLYNVCGNAAEMVNMKGKARGGSWRCPGGEVRISSVMYYQNSSVDVGFRVFIQVLEK
ncbi:MAG: formylglycine-generating enzyme family protein [Bacteroidetes bacterium]|nr:formylglycine-generating enzyme family protein [Bacteroidota bacterium]